MSLRMVLSLCLLACLVTAVPINTSGRSTRLMQQYTRYNNGQVIKYVGIFIYKGGQVRKLLEDGSAVTTFYQPHAVAYLGGKDGIYVYDDSTEKLEKYGTIDERVIGIAKSNNSDTLYIISEDHTVYKVTEGGTRKTKVDGADGATRIELDWEDNLYFIGADDQPYVVTANGVKKIEGLPLIDSPVLFIKDLHKLDNGLNLLYNDIFYDIYADGTSKIRELTNEEQTFYFTERREAINFVKYVTAMFENE